MTDFSAVFTGTVKEMLVNMKEAIVGLGKKSPNKSIREAATTL